MTGSLELDKKASKFEGNDPIATGTQQNYEFFRGLGL